MTNGHFPPPRNSERFAQGKMGCGEFSFVKGVAPQQTQIIPDRGTPALIKLVRQTMLFANLFHLFGDIRIAMRGDVRIEVMFYLVIQMPPEDAL